ncbi:MAG: peptidoglycan editing factor PgeF [Arcobacter sp.]|uniref:peptidoglycan editing factor PgeF n=1 Tax=uncultured Arcobacter sp. TaxID=165434 RepID=UPI000CBF1B66|nr:peptidoglycan editing factor PgeF [uncultured Arcobacter sp.]PLY11289.1 MAG: peptidoglycan editing factor PgeF [Arcobacter sp.]
MDTIKKIITTKDDGNVAYHVDDLKNSVDKNRLKLSQKYNFDISKLRYMNQVHGENIKIVDFNSPLLIDNCDALITKEKNLPIMVMVADCIPILLSDNKKGVIAVVHAGRNSTFLNIVQKSALMMIKELECKVEDINAYFGPSIQKCCYEVSPELENIAIKSFGKEFCKNRYLDLQGINVKQLNDIGVMNIEVSNICTKCSNEPYFSYRNNKDCGRFSIIGVIE